ncbi:mucin TcMUCII [Trypanosoma cruzi]|nr:mucin TcMUCII [Trypanosoma cruzi]
MRKRKAHAPHERRLTVWRGLYFWYQPGHRVPSGGTARRCDATPARSSTGLHALHITIDPVSVAPSLHCGDRPATASAGTSSRRERRNPFPTSERRIEVVLPNLWQSALVRPQYDGTCRRARPGVPIV